jgi:hypothetical protein
MNITSALSLLEVAKLGGKALSYVFGSDTDSAARGTSTDFAKLLAQRTEGLGLDGRNPALSDPETAYKMMTLINKSDLLFKAQFSELTDMGKRVEQLESLGATLSNIAPETANSNIVAQMGDFVNTYNQWIDRFAPAIANGGVLGNVQAAEVSRHSLESAVRSRFNGAAGGVRGLEDLGISIDPQTHRASFDESRLSGVLSSNKAGVVSAIDEFSANFAKSADLLNAIDNFIPKQLANRSRAIDFIASNLTQLQQEFGRGDVVLPSGQIATALKAYNQALAIR